MVPKPLSSAVTLYAPGCSARAMNSPLSSVTTVRDTPVVFETTVTDTPGNTALVSSVTVPAMSAAAPDVWALARRGAHRSVVTRRPTTARLRGHDEYESLPISLLTL